MDGIRFAAPLPQDLRAHHARWRERVFAPESAWYARLAADGQRPRTMLISCCDSRVDVVRIFGGEPGDLFVVRNVASLVPPCDADHGHHGTSAAIEYAVKALEVAHIVVMGHSDCGGAAACRRMCSGEAPEFAERGSFIGRWMDILRPGCERVSRGRHDPASLQRAIEEEAVLTSLRNLGSFPFVIEACAREALTLHGCWLDIATGRLSLYEPTTGRFA